MSHVQPAVRGRPRDASRDVVILDTVRSLLIEVGYDQLSIESVAGRAGVGKATIYRRYPDKATLVAAAVDRRTPWSPPPATGDLRAVLLATARWLAQDIGEQNIGLLGALFAGMRSDPALARAMRATLHRDQASLVGGPVADAITSVGENSHALALFAEITTAMIVHRVVIVGEPCDEAFLEHLVDEVLLPVLRRDT
jgi:AcrR family transcriptional regulator